MSATPLFTNDAADGLRRTARTFSLLSISVILLFFGTEGTHLASLTRREYMLLPFFPLGILLGLIIAWKNEMLGGNMTIISLMIFYFLHGLLTNGGFPRGWIFFALASPGFLFLLHQRFTIYAQQSK